MKKIHRLYIEKKPGFNTEAEKLLQDLRNNLGIERLEGLRILNRYDIADITAESLKQAEATIFFRTPCRYNSPGNFSF